MQLSSTTANHKEGSRTLILGTINPENLNTNRKIFDLPKKQICNDIQLPKVILNQQEAPESANAKLINPEAISQINDPLQETRSKLNAVQKQIHANIKAGKTIDQNLRAQEEALAMEVRYFAPKNKSGLTPNDTITAEEYQEEQNKTYAIADACLEVENATQQDLRIRRKKAREESMWKKAAFLIAPNYMLKREERNLAEKDSQIIQNEQIVPTTKPLSSPTPSTIQPDLYNEAKAKMQEVQSQILADTKAGKSVSPELRAQEEAIAMELRFFAPKNRAGQTPNDATTANEYREELNKIYAIADACEAVETSTIQDLVERRKQARKEKAQKPGLSTNIKSAWTSVKRWFSESIKSTTGNSNTGASAPTSPGTPSNPEASKPKAKKQGWFKKGLKALGLIAGITTATGPGCQTDSNNIIENTGGYTQSGSGGHRGSGGGTAESNDFQPIEPKIITINEVIITAKDPNKKPAKPATVVVPSGKTPTVTPNPTIKTPKKPNVKTPNEGYTPEQSELASSQAKAEIAKLKAEYTKLQQTGGGTVTVCYPNGIKCKGPMTAYYKNTFSNASDFIKLADQWVTIRDEHRGFPEEGGWTKEYHNQILFFIREAKNALEFFRNAPNETYIQCYETKSAINSALNGYPRKVASPTATAK